MSLEKVPTEIITKILSYLTKNEKGFIGLSSACKRFDQATQDVVHSEVWVRDRPFIFEISLDCEEEYIYAQMTSMLSAKHRNFAKLKLVSKERRTFSCNIIKACEDSLRLGKELTEQRFSAVVELELSKIVLFRSMRWLNGLLIHLVNLSYLTLSGYRASFDTFDPMGQRVAGKNLKMLKIESCGSIIWKSDFEYFLSNFPSIKLDISTCDITNWPRRTDWQHVFSYLRRHRAVLTQFVANETNIGFEELREILLDNTLRHIKITVKSCPKIRSRLWIEKIEILRNEVGDDNLARVTFFHDPSEEWLLTFQYYNDRRR